MMFQAATVLAVAGLALAAPSHSAEKAREGKDFFLPAPFAAAAPAVYAAPVATYAATYSAGYVAAPVAPIAPIATYATGYVAAPVAPIAPVYGSNNYYDSYRPNNAYAQGGRSDSDASVINNIEVVS